MGVRMVGDLTQLARALQKASKPDIKNRLGKPVGEALVSSTRERFRTSRDPTGRPWKSLSERTVQAGFKKKDYTKSGRLRKGVAEREAKRKILVQSARLKNSVSSDADSTRVAVGSNLDYARIHQQGGDAGRGKKVSIPARPYLGVSDDDQREIERLTERFLKEPFR